MRLLATVCAVVVVATLGGCAQSGYDASTLQNKLRHAGLTQQQAQCVTDAMENTFQLSELASHSAPTRQEETSTRALLLKCHVTLRSAPSS